MPTAPFSWAVSALRSGVAASLVTTPSNGLLGSFSPGSWSRTRTILPRTSTISVIVVPAFGGADAEADEDQSAFHLPLSSGAERQGDKLLARSEAGLPISVDQLRLLDGPRVAVDEVEALEVRPVGPDSLEAEPLEPRGDELGGQVVLGRRGQSAAEPVARQEEQVGLHVPLADRIIPGRGRLTPAGPECGQQRRDRDQGTQHAIVLRRESSLQRTLPTSITLLL